MTKIIATVGPASENILNELHSAGVDIFRFNLSHGSRDWHEKIIKKVPKGAEILLDTRGPEIRLGDIEGEIRLNKGEYFFLTINPDLHSEKEKIIFVSYAKLISSMRKGDRIAIDGGMLFAEVVDVLGESLKLRAESEWVLSSRRHVNLPGERVDLPTITEKDREDIEYFKGRFDYIALSFTRSAEDIRLVKPLVGDTKIIAKIENFEGVNNFTEILEESFGIMVARGDLGTETELERVPILQRKMLIEAGKSNKFSVVATEMLESMVRSPRPSRAEVSDIATAVWENASATMLSEETTIGKYPLKAVEIMKKVIHWAEE